MSTPHISCFQTRDKKSICLKIETSICQVSVSTSKFWSRSPLLIAFHGPTWWYWTQLILFVLPILNRASSTSIFRKSLCNRMHRTGISTRKTRVSHALHCIVALFVHYDSLFHIFILLCIMFTIIWLLILVNLYKHIVTQTFIIGNWSFKVNNKCGSNFKFPIYLS